jgi:uncharacterized protein YggE
LSSAVGDALQVRGVTLTIDDPEPLQRQSRRLAIQDAKSKASGIAEELGVELGHVLSIQDQHPVGLSGFVQATSRAAIPMSGNVPIEAGNVSASSVVTLIYAIGK